jgi:two-component system CheB/CheR fusion protein
VADRLLQIIEAVPARVAVFDREMRYLHVSKRWVEDYRLNEAEIIGRSHYEVFPELPERWKEVHRRCLAGAVERSDEDRFERLDGSVDWSRWEVRPWREPDGQIGGILIAAEDITARKHTEVALRESEARFRVLHRLAVRALEGQSEAALLRTVLDAALEVTGAQKGNVQIYDERAGRLRIVAHHGFAPAFLEFFACVRDDDAAACRESLRRNERVVVEDIARSALFAGTQAQTVLLDEGVRAVQSTPIVSREGKVVGVFSTHWLQPHRLDEATLLTLDLLARDAADIIQRLHAEQALMESERRRELALSVAQLGIYELDTETGETRWDARIREIWGIGPDEPVTYDTFIASVHADDREALRAEVAKARTPGSTPAPRAEFRIVRPDGSTRWVSGSAVVELSAGRPVRVLGTIEDVSERTLAAEALKQSEARFRESSARLAEADRRKDEFLAMLAHELRNPLAAIHAAVELLRRRPDPEPALQRAGAIMGRQIQQLVRMVDELLEVSRITSGKLTLKTERTHLMSVVNTAVETSRPLLEAKELRLSVLVPPVPIAFDADPARLAQALVNLLTNAAKYTPAGGQVSLSAACVGGKVVFRVKDSGIGIAPEMLEPIFELFVQANESLDRVQGGLGLGLPLVRRIVELHGGTVTAFSDGPGRGSEFVIQLAAECRQVDHAPPRPGPRAQNPSRRILVVEDNRDLAEGLGGLLAGSGHAVRVAYDGLKGLELAEALRPEVVLLDIGLPLLDGYEVARRLRRLPGLQRTMIIALSGYGDAKDRERSRQAGFDHHLVKPAEVDKIEELLASIALPAND